jgi:hypothetical protein
MNYFAFGLSFESHNLTIPELSNTPVDLTGQSGINSTDVVIKAEDPNQWPHLPLFDEQEPELRITHGELQLAVEDVGHFRITHGNRIAWSRWSPSVGDQDIRSYLLGSALGALLIQRGMLVLHGNALTKNGQAIVCVGDSGAGKSTLAYALMQAGWGLLADDLVAITPDGIVLPGVQRIKLWLDAVEAFGLDPAQLTPIQAGVDKFQLSGDSIQAARFGVPLKVCYVLPDDEPADRPDQATIRSIPLASDREAMATLLANVFRPQFVEGLGMQGSNFLAIAALMRKIPQYHLIIPGGISHLSERLAGFDLLQSTTP